MECGRWDKQEDSAALRQIFNAYAVLSIDQSRMEFDLPTGKEWTDENFQGLDELRDDNIREQKLSDERNIRKTYNINKFGRYMGGVPNRRSDIGRGKALDAPGAFHSFEMQNEIELGQHVTDFHVTRQDAVEFGRYMQEDRANSMTKRTWLRAKIDDNYFRVKRNNAFVYFVLAIALLPILSNISSGVVEAMRRRLPKEGLGKNIVATENGVLKIAH